MRSIMRAAVAGLVCLAMCALPASQAMAASPLPAAGPLTAPASSSKPPPKPASSPSPQRAAVRRPPPPGGPSPTSTAARQPGPLDQGGAHITAKPNPASRAAASAASGASLNCAPGLACQNLAYHTGFLGLSPGPVMHSVTAYLIFWFPNGSAAPSAGYQRLIERFVRDAGNTPYFNLLDQYCDNNACPPAGMSLGGTWTDIGDAYPHAGTTSDPLQDGDIQHEVDTAISANGGWDASADNIYLVYTAPNVNSCASGNSCTFPTPNSNGFCAYHSQYHQGFLGLGAQVIYANMPYGDSFGCDITGTIAGGPNDGQRLLVSPNNDLAADSEVSVSSHELFEAITDYQGNAWYADDANNDEIGDLCNFYLGPTVRSDGSNVTLHDDRFAVQQEWSNSGSGCALPESVPDAIQGVPATATFHGSRTASSICTQQVLGPNDDGSTGTVPLPFPVDFFGTTFNQLYVNNNGNVTFNGPLATFTPFGLAASNIPIIAPYFADVDTRAPGSSVVTYGGVAATGGSPATFCVDWVNVGYYGIHDDRLNSFQLVLQDESGATGHAGDFDMIFDYGPMAWETGDASGGTGGLGGSSARAGYSNGSTRSVEITGSGLNGALLDGGSNALSANNLNSLQTGRYLFSVRNGVTPAGGTISGTVRDSASPPNPVVGALVQICTVAGGATTCALATTGTTGSYSAVGLAAGQYVVAVSPPAGSPLFARNLGPFTLTQNGTLQVDFTLAGPQPPPAGTTIGSSFTGAGGIPVLYWLTTNPLSTQGCPGGSASFVVSAGDATGQPASVSGTLTESPPGSGHYTGTVPTLFPMHGPAQVTITISCPNPSQSTTVSFSIYIDPSGRVVSPTGTPIAGATVTLLRADTAAGPFLPVSDGSPVMSPANRANPATTSSDGMFGWDVLAGFYQVRAARAGCTSPTDPRQAFVESAVFQVPPPATDLTLTLACQTAAAPPRADQVVSASLTTPGSTITSPAVTTTAANELVLALVSGDGPQSPTQQVAAVSGGGLSWSLVGRSNAAFGSAEVWEAYATSRLTAMTVAATLRTTGYDAAITVATFAGAAPHVGASAIAAGPNGAPGTTLTTTRSNSLVWAVGEDYSRAVARSPIAGQQLVSQFLDTRAGETFWTQDTTSPVAAAGTVVDVGDTAPTADRWDLTAVEIAPAQLGVPGFGTDVVRTTDQTTPSATFASPPVSTASGNELLLALVSTDGPKQATQAVSGVTGGGLTWTRATGANAAWGAAEVWQAYATTPISGASITATLAAGGYDGSITVVAFTGARPQVGATGAQAGTSGAPGVSLTTTVPGSTVWGVGHDWTHPAPVTAGAGQALVNQFRDTTVHDTSWAQQTGPVSGAGTAVAVAVTGPTTDRWDLAAVEVLPAG